MDVDHNATGDHTTEKGDACTGDDDFDLKDEDLLDVELSAICLFVSQ
jgi:hypothetical protein